MYPKGHYLALRLTIGLCWMTLAGAALVARPAAAQTVDIAGGPAHVLSFADLGTFKYEVVDLGTGASPEQIEEAKKRDQVPESIRALAGKRVAMVGYVLPLKMEGELATELIFMKDVTTCCYGAVPQMNDYAVVKMTGKPAKVVQDIPVTLVGILEVGERYEEGYLVSLFRLQGEALVGP